MTTMTSHSSGRRTIDLASLALLVIGVVFGIVAFRLVADEGRTPLLLIPAVVAVTIGLTHLFKREAPRP